MPPRPLEEKVSARDLTPFISYTGPLFTKSVLFRQKYAALQGIGIPTINLSQSDNPQVYNGNAYTNKTMSS